MRKSSEATRLMKLLQSVSAPAAAALGPTPLYSTKDFLQGAPAAPKKR